MADLTLVHRLWPSGIPLLLYLILMTMAYSKRAKATNIVQVRSQRSMRENVSEAGELSLAAPEMLMSIKSVVMRRDILPGTRSGGIRKLKRCICLIHKTFK